MAIGTIDVDVKVVRDVSGGLVKDAASIDEIIEELNKIEEEIREAWKSRYTEEYIECLTDIRKKLIKIHDSVVDISSSLNKTADSVERTEQKLNNIFTSGGGGSSEGAGSTRSF